MVVLLTCFTSPRWFIYTYILISYVAFCTLQLLNQIVCELPPEHPLSNVRPLRDSLGHTPLQVWCAFFQAYCCYHTYSYRDVYYLLCLVTNSFHSQVILLFGVYSLEWAEVLQKLLQCHFLYVAKPIIPGLIFQSTIVNIIICMN